MSKERKVKLKYPVEYDGCGFKLNDDYVNSDEFWEELKEQQKIIGKDLGLEEILDETNTD